MYHHCATTPSLKITSCCPAEVTSSAILDDFDGHQDGRGGGDANSSQERVETQGLMLGMTVGGKEEGGGGNPSGKPSKWNQCTFQCALCLKTSNRCCHIKTTLLGLHSHVQGGFFDWSALKMTKYEEKLKYLNWSANCSS